MKTSSPARLGLILIALAVIAAGALLSGSPAAPSADPQLAAGVTPVNISRTSTDSTFEYPGNGSVHTMGVDQNGKAYVVWYEWMTPRRFVFATNRGGSWSGPIEIEQLNWENTEAGFPVMDVSAGGSAHLMFHDGRPPMIDADIFHLAFENGAWTGTTNVSGIGTGSGCYGGVAISPVDGTTFVVWEENQADVAGEWLLMLRYRTVAGQWSNIQRLADSSPLVWGYLPKIAIDSRGTAHMVYGYAHTSTLWYSKNATPTNPAGWTNPIRIKETGLDWSFFSLACDNAGNAYLAWDDATTGNLEIFLRRINSNGTIGSEVNVSRSAAASSEPALAVNRATGDLLVAWTENNDIFVNAFLNGNWSGPGNITNSASPCMQPSVAVDPSGGAHLAYASQVNGNWEIMYMALAAGITVLSPNGGESWYSGTPHNITWASSGVSGNVKIEFSSNAGQSWSVAAESTANTGSYAWTVPATLSAQCLIRVSSLDGAKTDRSDASFSIVTASTGLIRMNRTALAFGAAGTSAVTAHQSVLVSNGGTGTMSWTAVSDQGWLSAAPASGSGTGTLLVGVNPSGFGAGTYTGSVRVSSADAVNSPQTITVTMTVYGSGASGNPFGVFESPANGTTASSSLPVTGWVLDNVEVAGVKIYRTASPGEPENPPGLVYIGDAVLVEGARPDVELAHPGFPFSYRSGWGYMLLTNFLPNSGNGAVTLVALAADKEGHRIELGRNTITCDNANAVKPFGTIDTPVQGGTASGASYVNFGWALTPLPAMIPIDGSTITVYIDGIAVGHPTYNQYRSDIATNLPGYLNSGGAVGYRRIDTTAYANGVHTIAWIVTDNAGHADGVGSRFFSVMNAGSAPAGPGPDGFVPDITDLAVIPSNPAPILARRGFGRGGRLPVHARLGAAFEVEIPETGLLEIALDRGREEDRLVYRGYQIVGGEVRPLPSGSTLDPKSGLWTWQPGPGFLGSFDLVFVAERDGRPESKTAVRVRIAPF